jgi:hypothetical protein
MAQILSFRTPEYRSSEGPSPRAGVAAEVIIFPGVRYERWDEAHAVPIARGEERRTSRDVLELAE